MTIVLYYYQKRQQLPMGFSVMPKPWYIRDIYVVYIYIMWLNTDLLPPQAGVGREFPANFCWARYLDSTGRPNVERHRTVCLTGVFLKS